MANTIKIAGDIRDEFGKGAARRMRVAKLIPATLYAGGDQPTFVKLPMKGTTLAPVSYTHLTLPTTERV